MPECIPLFTPDFIPFAMPVLGVVCAGQSSDGGESGLGLGLECMHMLPKMLVNMLFKNVPYVPEPNHLDTYLSTSLDLITLTLI